MNFVEPIRDADVFHDIQASLLKTKPRNYVLVMTGTYTGLRISDILKLKVKDVRNKKYIDVKEKKTNKRNIIEINPLLRKVYKDYTVMIGDCLFMVPPTSIRVVNQIDSERVHLLRSKGAMTKTRPHTDRIIEMTLYFNGDEGINGVAVQKQLPRQKGTNEFTTYYMNGLRSLIAM